MSLKIDQALISDFVSASFGLPIAHENFPYEPVPGTAYAELLILPNPIEPRSLADTDETTGIMRIILRYPVNEGAGNAKTKAEQIMARYSIGMKVTYSGQSVTILSKSRQPGYSEEGWFKVVVSINYYALIAR